MFVGQPWAVLGHERRRQRPARHVLDNFAVLGGAEPEAYRRPLVSLAHVPVERLEVELQLPEILGFELVDLQLNRDEALKVAVKLRQKASEVLDEPSMKVVLGMDLRKVQKFDEIRVSELPLGVGMTLS